MKNAAAWSVLALCLLTGSLGAAPANDLFGDAVPITGISGVSGGSNVGGSKEAGEPNHAGDAGGSSIWYAWSAPASGTIEFRTCESAFDTLLAVYQGPSVDALTEVASNDQSCGNQSKVSFNAASGQVYYVTVDGFQNQQGDITLRWGDVPPPANDAFANATSLPSARSGTLADQNNFGSTKETGEPLHAGEFGDTSVWYDFVAPADSTYTFNTCTLPSASPVLDTMLAVYRGDAVDDLAPAASNDQFCANSSQVQFQATAGETLRIAVAGYFSGEGNFTLTWFSAPPNDDIADAELIGGAAGTTTGTNVAATKEVDEASHAGNAGGVSVWYRWTAPSAGNYGLKACGSSFDTLLAVYTRLQVGAVSLIAANDDFCDVQSDLQFGAEAGKEYYIAIDGYDGAQGSIALEWYDVGGPTNDNFANAMALGIKGTTTLSSVGATAEANEPAHGGVPAEHSLWWWFTPPSDGALVLDTYRTSELGPVTIAVYTGTAVNNLVLVTEGDSSQGFDPLIYARVLSGQPVYIAIDSPQEIPYILDYAFYPTPPANDNFANAEQILGESGAALGHNLGATIEPDEPDHGQLGGTHSVWYKWTAPRIGTMTIDACPYLGEHTVAAYTGTSLDNLQSIKVTLSPYCLYSFPADSGTTYYIAVDGLPTVNNGEGPFELSWELTPLALTERDAFQAMGIGEGAYSLTFSADESRFLTGGWRGAFLWDTASGGVIRRFEGHTAQVVAAAFSPNGNRVATGSIDNTAALFDTATGQRLFLLRGHLDRVSDVKFSRDGATLITASFDGTVKFWNVSTGGLIRTLTPGGGIVRTLAVSPDGTRLAVHSNVNVSMYNLQTGAHIWTIDHVSGQIAFTPDGQQLIGNDQHEILRWRVSDGGVASTIPPPVGESLDYSYDLSLSPDGTKLANSTFDNNLYVWNLSTGARTTVTNAHDDTITSVIFSRDGSKIYTASVDRTVKVWSAALANTRTYTGHTGQVWNVAISPDTMRVLTAANDAVRMWDTRTGALLHAYTDHTDIARDVAFSPDGTRFASCSDDHTVCIYNADTHSLLHTYQEYASPIKTVAYSNGGDKIAAGYDNGRVVILNASTGGKIGEFHATSGFDPFYDELGGVAFSDDDTRIVTGSVGAEAAVWDVTNLSNITNVTDLVGHQSAIEDALFSHDGATVLTTASDKTARFWDPDSGKELNRLHTSVGWFVRGVYSPDSTQVLTGNLNGLVDVWDPVARQRVETFQRDFDLTGLAFSPDATKIVTAAPDGTAITWERKRPRAIIVSGGGPFKGNSIARQTHELAGFAYRTLRARQYDPDDILFLDSFPDSYDLGDGLPALVWDVDGDGVTDVDSEATVAALKDAITGPFAAEGGRLFIVMIDHGYKTGDFMAFRMNPNEAVLTTTMNGWLNTLQNAAPVDVTLVVDCCYSGRFVEDCKKTAAIPANRGRVVIASTSTTAEAVFLPAPDLTSFLHTFLGSAYMGNSLGEAWRAGWRFFDRFPVAKQVPMMHDGFVQASDDTINTANGNREFFGASWAYGVQVGQNVNQFFPAFASVGPTGTVGVGQPVTITATLLPFQSPVEVNAAIRPPAPEVLSGEPITALPRIALAKTGGTPATGEVWSATATPLFAAEGPYTISLTASYENNRISDPSIANVTVTNGPDPDPAEVRAIIAVGSGSTPELESGLRDAASFAFTVYANRFVEIGQDGTVTPRGDWIQYLSPYKLLYASKEKSQLKRSQEFALRAYQQRYRPNKTTAGDVLALIDSTDSQAERLFVHLVAETAAGGNLMFGGAGNKSLDATSLDAHLDAFQARATHPEVVLIVDAANAGTFLPTCAATSGQKRIVLSSGRADDCALFLDSPPSSFTHKFCAAAWGGNDIWQSWSSTRTFFQGFLPNLLGAAIRPQIDADGDGVLNEILDQPLASGIYLGRRLAFAGDEASGLPFILEGTVENIPAPGGNALVRARLLEGVLPDRVYVKLVPPGLACTGTVTNVPEFDLARDGGSPEPWTWSAQVPVGYLPNGEQPITFYAEYADTGGEKKLSEPVFTSTAIGDVFEGDPYFDSSPSETKNFLEIADREGLPQEHTLHDETDEDWVVAMCWSRTPDGELVSIPFSLQFSDLSIPPGSGIRVEVFTDGMPDPDQYGETCGESDAFDCRNVVSPDTLNWNTSGLVEFQPVFIRIKWTGTPSSTGDNIRYTISFARDTGANNAVVGAIGTTGTKAGAPTAYLRFGGDGATSDGYGVDNSTGIRVYRSFIGPPTYQPTGRAVVGPDILPGSTCSDCSLALPMCGTTATLSPVPEKCFQIVDTFSGVTIPPGTMMVGYEIYAVHNGVESSGYWTLPVTFAFAPASTCSLTLPSCGAIANPPVLGVSTAQIDVSTTQGSSPTPRTFKVTNTGGGSMNFTAAVRGTPGWLSLTSGSGTLGAGLEQTVTVNFNSPGLSPNSYQAFIDVTSTGTSGSPKAITVNLTVNPPATTPGDANGSGTITPEDAQLAFQCFLLGSCPAGTTATGANLCPPPAITPADAQGIFNTYLGITPACP